MAKKKWWWTTVRCTSPLGGSTINIFSIRWTTSNIPTSTIRPEMGKTLIRLHQKLGIFTTYIYIKPIMCTCWMGPTRFRNSVSSNSIPQMALSKKTCPKCSSVPWFIRQKWWSVGMDRANTVCSTHKYHICCWLYSFPKFTDLLLTIADSGSFFVAWLLMISSDITSINLADIAGWYPCSFGRIILN